MEVPEEGNVLVGFIILGAQEGEVGGRGSFQGCISNVVLNNHQPDLTALTQDPVFNVNLGGVAMGCDSGDLCTASDHTACPAHSGCVSQGWRDLACMCDPRFALIDGRCVDPCNPNPCQNFATCVVATTTSDSSPFSCDCDPTHSGVLCQVEGCGLGLIGSAPRNCHRCVCDPRGVQDEICDAETGECSCKVRTYTHTYVMVHGASV